MAEGNFLVELMDHAVLSRGRIEREGRDAYWDTPQDIRRASETLRRVTDSTRSGFGSEQTQIWWAKAWLDEYQKETCGG